MKLTDERLKSLLEEDKIVMLQRGLVKMALTQDCYENVLNNLGGLVEKTDWHLVGVME